MMKNYIHESKNAPNTAPLFLNRSGNKLTRHGIALILKKYVEKAKSDCSSLATKTVSPHTLRHSKAMHLLQAGIDLMKIRDILGHESVTTTEIYARTNDTDLRLALSRVNPVSENIVPTWHNSPGIMARLASFAKNTPK